jgi:hypothetical protein
MATTGAGMDATTATGTGDRTGPTPIETAICAKTGLVVRSIRASNFIFIKTSAGDISKEIPIHAWDSISFDTRIALLLLSAQPLATLPDKPLKSM